MLLVFVLFRIKTYALFHLLKVLACSAISFGSFVDRLLKYNRSHPLIYHCSGGLRFANHSGGPSECCLWLVLREEIYLTFREETCSQ